MQDKRSFLTVFILLGLLCWGSLPPHALGQSGLIEEPPYGPLRLVNQQPLQLLFLQLFPDVAEVTPLGRPRLDLNVALSNTLVQQNRAFTADLDLEMVRSVFDLRYGVYPRVELGLEVPVLYTYGGILDDFILGVERLIIGDMARALRREQTSGAFTYRVLRGDRLILQGEDNVGGLGDMVLKAKVHLVDEQTWIPALSVRVAVKFPTGDVRRAFGSGAFDAAVGVLAQKTFGRWTFYANADVTVPGQAFGQVVGSLQPFFSGVLAIERRLAPPLSLVLQLHGDTRPFHRTVPILDERILEVLLGLNWALNRHTIVQFGVAEDQFNSACCSADVSFFLNVSGRL